MVAENVLRRMRAQRQLAWAGSSLKYLSSIQSRSCKAELAPLVSLLDLLSAPGCQVKTLLLRHRAVVPYLLICAPAWLATTHVPIIIYEK